MLKTKKLAVSLAIAAGLGSAILAAPTANAAVSAEPLQNSGCFYNYQWYDFCPTIGFDNRNDREDAQDRSRDRRRDRDRDHEDHGGHH